MTINVTEEILVNLLREWRKKFGNPIVSLELETVPAMTQKSKDKARINPYWDRLSKRYTVSCSVGPDYEKAVNRALVRAGAEPDFEAGPRAWGERNEDVVVEHKGSLYLVIHQHSRSEEIFYSNGEKAVDRANVEEFLRPPSPGPVTYRNPKLASVRSVTYYGNTYVVVR